MAFFKRHLREFLEDNTRSLNIVMRQLETVFGTLYRVGGEDRIYDIEGTSQKAAIYVFEDSVNAIAIAWTSNKIQSIYWWDAFSVEVEPSYAIDLPDNGDFSEMLPTIAYMLKDKTMGEMEINA